MRIGIVGAGFAGLTTAKVMKQLGHDVIVFEKAPDIGGVWSRTRRYPGLATQNNRSTYGFADFPMPSSYPEWPSGAQVQAYLESYATQFELDPHLRLSCEVVRAEPEAETGCWAVHTSSGEGAETHVVDHLVICNGIFSEPYVPTYPGLDDFTAAGGRLCHASAFTALDEARGKDVVVVGYGKSACDVAAAVSGIASSTTVVARELLWKMPRRIAGLNYKYLLLTRMGEALFPYIEPSGFERVLHGRRGAAAAGMLRSVESVVTRQLRLRQLDLVPAGSLQRIARSTVSLATEGFYDTVASGEIGVRKGTSITRLCAVEGKPYAELSDGAVIPADLVVCGTGFVQQVPFVDPDINDRLHDERGNFLLYRQILPLDVPGLSFNGYNSSFFSPLSAEVAAWWTGALLAGELALPSVAQQRSYIENRLRWMEERTEGKHARGTNIIPFSVHNLDEMLSDLDLRLPTRTRLLQWLLPVDPRSFRQVGEVLRARCAPATGEATAGSGGPAGVEPHQLAGSRSA